MTAETCKRCGELEKRIDYRNAELRKLREAILNHDENVRRYGKSEASDMLVNAAIGG